MSNDDLIVRRLKWLIEGYDLGYFNKADVMARATATVQHQEWEDGL